MSLAVAGVRPLPSVGHALALPCPTRTCVGWLVMEPPVLEHVSESVYVPATDARTLRGESGVVTSVQPGSEAATPPRVAEPEQVVAPVTDQLTVNGVPVSGFAETVSGKLFGVGGPDPPPQPLPVRVTPVAMRSVPLPLRRKPFASVVTSQFNCVVVVMWMVTWASALVEMPITRRNAQIRRARRRVAT